MLRKRFAAAVALELRRGQHLANCSWLSSLHLHFEAILLPFSILSLETVPNGLAAFRSDVLEKSAKVGEFCQNLANFAEIDRILSKLAENWLKIG